MTENTTPSRTRSRLLKGGGAVLGVAAIGAALSLTASQWSDSATVEGDVSVGSFSITFDSADLQFGQFVPEESQTSSHVLTPDLSTDATLTLAADVPEDLDYTVTVDGTEFTAGGPGITLSPEDDALDVVITAELADGAAPGAGAAENASFTFTAEQIVETGGEETGTDG